MPQYNKLSFVFTLLHCSYQVNQGEEVDSAAWQPLEEGLEVALEVALVMALMMDLMVEQPCA